MYACRALRIGISVCSKYTRIQTAFMLNRLVTVWQLILTDYDKSEIASAHMRTKSVFQIKFDHHVTAGVLQNSIMLSDQSNQR